MKKNTAAWARDLARKHLEGPLPRRWAHTQGVARQARTLAPILGDQADLLEAAAWLHDIGYAPDLVSTGFHPLDGARYLHETHDTDAHLCRLVAHHSCALVEARERGLAIPLIREFGNQAPHLSGHLIYCDMTTSPHGEPLSVEQRITEILARYGKDHLVARAITRASPSLVSAVQQVSRELTLASNCT
ncbi:metal-dependent phosphohydrolase, HD subdomain protein [Actinomadura coerulea]|uniref:HD domain-containing protein n=1 Tax=Actinomadura coerulea TaxID=46159 RepID=UPI001618F1A3|nr:HD domain-containing protein [Actinomadura coerulea]GGQ39135.1 metal-dependent phosphohydrolase, HD subdomain protein [Actinomadura coerulea]